MKIENIKIKVVERNGGDEGLGKGMNLVDVFELFVANGDDDIVLILVK